MMAGLPPILDILEEYQLVEAEDRYRLLIDLGRQLEPMPDALKTDATKVRGCSASVWVYPTVQEGRLPSGSVPGSPDMVITVLIPSRPASLMERLRSSAWCTSGSG